MPKAGIEPAMQTHVYLGFTVQCPAIGHLRRKTLFFFAWPQKEKAGKLQKFLLKRPARPKNPGFVLAFGIFGSGNAAPADLTMLIKQISAD